MKTIGGFLCIRNGLQLDYCFELAIQSMLPFVDALVVSESESTDGTRELLDEWAKREPKLKIVSYPWTNPIGDSSWWVQWLNSAREHLTTDYAVYLDGDEVWGDNAAGFIRQAAFSGQVLLCHRLNFWKDAWHLCPHGENCGFEVIRVGPRNLWFPSDCPDAHSGEIERLARRSQCEIFHYGFLRHREPMFLKAREVLRIWGGSYDPRMEEVEKSDPSKNWMEEIKNVPWINRLIPFSGRHPVLAVPWLRERGMKVNDDGTKPI